MTNFTPISRALISVTNKVNLDILARSLHERGVEIISTGGTANYIESLGIPVISISEITNFPEILEGRVKTLHPNIYANILMDRNNDKHVSDMEKYVSKSGYIDLVVVNLYEFEKELQKTSDLSSIIEKIDIGGPCLLRASAKNFEHVTVLSSPYLYEEFLENFHNSDGKISYELRQKLAYQAFSDVTNYDIAIRNYFESITKIVLDKKQNLCEDKKVNISLNQHQKLRYGENSHQSASFLKFANHDTQYIQHQGKELSYNNISDLNSALAIVANLNEHNTYAIVKHENPCGVASGTNALDVYKEALSCDNISAFGGIVVTNREIDEEIAKEMVSIFYEVIAAPKFTLEALKIFQTKKNLRIIEIDPQIVYSYPYSFKTALGGVLLQTNNEQIYNNDIHDIRCVTNNIASPEILAQMDFAFRIVKHVKSNGIVLCANNRLLGAGTGQVSRIDAIDQAIAKMYKMNDKNDLKKFDIILASDAFFPFTDNIELIAKYNISYVIQPSGSVRDNEVIQAANKHGITMYFSDIRHFKH